MSADLAQLSHTARNAVYRRDWPTVASCSEAMLTRDAGSAEGHFLAGLALKAAQRHHEAEGRFRAALELDAHRHDAAIELAAQLAGQRRHGDAAELIRRYRDSIDDSPVYLHLAGTVLASLGLPLEAHDCLERAVTLQPGVDLFEASLAACHVFVGRIDEAKAAYRRLLRKHPAHQRYHYQLARLERARDSSHIEAMQDIVARDDRPDTDKVFLYYALGKEFEDLGRWDEAFDCFRRAGDAVTRVAVYDPAAEQALLRTLIDSGSPAWLADNAAAAPGDTTPIFIGGLPRSGTTLLDRILTGNGQVESVGETQYLPESVLEVSGLTGAQRNTPAMVRAAAAAPAGAVATAYRSRVAFLLGGASHFVDKLPFNVLYFGFAAKAFPDARLVLIERSPLDACFALYKQVFTGAYKFSYSLNWLGQFYIAYRELVRHWQAVLGDRLVLMHYETLVGQPEQEARRLFDALGLDFDPACLDITANGAATATASAVQVREGIHGRSVGRWRHYARQLAPLREMLERSGIDCGPGVAS